MGGSDAAAFLAGSVKAAVPNGFSKDGAAEQPQHKMRKKAKASQEPEKHEQPQAAQPDSASAEQKKSGKKRKVKDSEDGAPVTQGSKRQHAGAGDEQLTVCITRTKKLK